MLSPELKLCRPGAITTRFAAWGPRVRHDDRIAGNRPRAGFRRGGLWLRFDTELRSLREEETLSAYPGERPRIRGTASAIARRVAEESGARFGWLQVPREASDDPPVDKAETDEVACVSAADTTIQAATSSNAPNCPIPKKTVCAS